MTGFTIKEATDLVLGTPAPAISPEETIEINQVEKEIDEKEAEAKEPAKNPLPVSSSGKGKN